MISVYRIYRLRFVVENYSSLDFPVLQQEFFTPHQFRSMVEVEAPTTKIYRFHGAIVHPTGERIPVGTENLLLRECILKNTDFIEGIVVYAGNSHLN